MRRKYGVSIGVFLAILVVGVLWQAGVCHTGTFQTGGLVSMVRPVPTAVLKPMPPMQTREFPGRVRANQRVQLAFSVSGLLTKLDARQGKMFKKGDVIAQLDQRDFKNSLAVAQANFDDSRQSFERNTTLRDKKIIAEATFDAAKAAYDAAKAELSIARKALEDTILHAPFDGVVAERFVENHEHIDAKQEIVSFQDISRVEVVLQIPERLIARSGASGLHDIQVKFDSDGGEWFNASVREFGMQADSVTRTYELVLEMVPPKSIKVYSGMTASVRAKINYKKEINNWTPDIVLVPLKAIGEDPDKKAFVWVVGDKEGKPKKVYIKLGAMRSDGVEVRSGLRSGMRVATAGLYSLEPDMEVRPMRDGGEGLDG